MTTTRRSHRSLIALAITALTLFALPSAASAVVPIRNITVTPSTWDFGTMRLGSDQLFETLTITNANSSNSTWTYTGSSITNSDGSIAMHNESGCMSQTLTPGSSCSVQVWLAPSTTGHKTGTYTPLIGNANGVGSTDFTADVNDPQATLSTSNVIDWDYVDFNGGMVSKTETITNSGVGPLHITDVGITGVDIDQWDYSTADCGAGNPPFTLAEGESCDIVVKFYPWTMDYMEAALNLQFEGGDIPGAHINLYAGVDVQALHAIDSNWSFAPREVSAGPSAAAPITFENPSMITDTINSYSIAGADAADFQFKSSDCGLSLTATTACTASVVFDPTSAGAKSANLHIVYDSPRGTLDIPLDGVGIADPVSDPPAPPAAATPIISASAIKPAALKKIAGLDFNVGCGAASCTLSASSKVTVTRKKGKALKYTLTATAVATSGGTVKLTVKPSSSQLAKWKAAKSVKVATTFSTLGASPLTLNQSLK